MVKKSLQMRADDPAIEFAAAIMTRDGREAVSAEHARVARAGAQADRLLARKHRTAGPMNRWCGGRVTAP
jgi:hypothetical protein